MRPLAPIFRRTIVICLTLVGAAGCSDDPGVLAVDGRLEFKPAALDFGPVPPGMRRIRSLSLRNAGAGRLTLRFEGADGSGFGWPAAPLALASGQSHAFQVDFRSDTAGAHTGMLRILDDQDQVFEVPLSAHVPRIAGAWVAEPPHCPDQPESVALSSVVLGEAVTRTLAFENRGEAEILIEGAEVDPPAAFSVILPEDRAVPPGASASIGIRSSPVTPGSHAAEIQLQLSGAVAPALSVCGSAIESQPQRLCLDTDVLHFGQPGAPVERALKLSACGGDAVTVSAIEWAEANPAFSFASAPWPFTLAPGEARSVGFRFTPGGDVESRARAVVRSDDSEEPEQYVSLSGGSLVPQESGRFLYFWRVNTAVTGGGGDIIEMPLQGPARSRPIYGPATGQKCSGCHQSSPDGRYLAFLEHVPDVPGGRQVFRVRDNQEGTLVDLPFEPPRLTFMSWNPNPNTDPPYQFVYDGDGDIHKASVVGGYLGKVAGASEAAHYEAMPSWGADRIAFVRAERGHPGATGVGGEVRIFTVTEGASIAVPVPGASDPGTANYYPAISPNGRWLVFNQSAAEVRRGTTAGARDAQLRLIDLAQPGAVNRLPGLNRGASSFPTWSLDGRFLSFSSNRDAAEDRPVDWDIFVASFDPLSGATGAPISLQGANGPQFEHAAVWSR